MALQDNLIEYWKLDESSGNAVGVVSSTTLTNTGTASYASAKINNGVDFGSTNTTKWLNEITSNLGIDGGACSLAGWVKLSAEIGAGNWCFFNTSSGTSKTWQYIEYNYNSGTRRLSFSRDKAGVGDQGPKYTITMGTSDWYHLVYTYDGTNVRAYINGSLVGGPTAASGNGSTTVSSSGFSIGDRIYSGGALGNKVRGIQDEVGLWSRAITADEVTALYNSGNGLAYPFSTTNIKTIDGLAKASVKNVNGLAIASVKNYDGLA